MLTVLGAVCAWLWIRDVRRTGTQSPASRAAATRDNALCLGAGCPSGRVEIAVHPLAELDGETRDQIDALRRSRVAEHGDLVVGPYLPSDAVFGQIEDRKPWWGVEGIIDVGPGLHGIDGVSKESDSVGNPFLLLGVGEAYAHVLRAPYARPAASTYPVPVALVIDPQAGEAVARFRVSPYLQYQRDTNASQGRVHLKDYNARDFGFHYLALDAGRSTNVIQSVPSEGPVPIIQFIHCGGSCGYPGGCNNMSPAQPALDWEITAVPARAVVKLWRRRPPSIAARPDLTYTLEME